MAITTGSRVKRKRGDDQREGKVVEVNAYNCATIKWNIPAVNTVTGAIQHHSTINIKNLIDLDEPIIENKKINPDPDFGLFNQK